jgi:hypothetical protein
MPLGFVDAFARHLRASLLLLPLFCIQLVSIVTVHQTRRYCDKNL